MLKGFTVVFGIASFFYASFLCMRSSYDEGHKQGLQEAHIQSIGRPMKYKDLPRGQYRVLAVVNEYSQTAVVERISRADGLIREDAKVYFLVTDMMPQQMKEGYIWGEMQ